MSTYGTVFIYGLVELCTQRKPSASLRGEASRDAGALGLLHKSVGLRWSLVLKEQVGLRSGSKRHVMCGAGCCL